MVQSTLPWPPVQAAGNDPCCAAAMLDNAGGQISEMSAIGFYCFHSLAASAWQEVTDAFRQICRDEMRHLEIFSTLAMQLGAEPRLWSPCGSLSSRCRYWTPAYLTYHTGLDSILAAAMDEEERSRQKYLMQAAWIQDENVCDNLRRIAEDEILHLQILKGLYEKYVPPDETAGKPVSPVFPPGAS